MTLIVQSLRDPANHTVRPEFVTATLTKSLVLMYVSSGNHFFMTIIKDFLSSGAKQEGLGHIKSTSFKKTN